MYGLQIVHNTGDSGLECSNTNPKTSVACPPPLFSIFNPLPILLSPCK